MFSLHALDDDVACGKKKDFYPYVKAPSNDTSNEGDNACVSRFLRGEWDP